MRRISLLLVLFTFMFLSGLRSEGEAEFIPVFYESSIVLGGGSVLPLSADRTGGYMVLDPEHGELIKLNNELNEVWRVSMPLAGENWFNEVVVGPDHTIWVSSGYFFRVKVFLQYDSGGNLLRTLYYRNTSMTYVANFGIQVDAAGCLYFVSSSYSPAGSIMTWLNRLDPRAGTLTGRWQVPVDGGYHWHRGMVMNSQGELLWGNFESRTIYRFSPQTGQTTVFGYLPSLTQTNTLNLAIDSSDNLYAIEQPSEFWRYDPSFLYRFDSFGNYQGRREINFQAAGVGLAAFEDELVLSSYYTGILIKYTSVCKNSIEYPFCIYSVQDTEELTRQYMALGTIKAPDGQKILLELRKVAEDLQKNMVDSAVNTLNQLIHYVAVKSGRSIDREVGYVYIRILEQTKDNLMGDTRR